MPIYPFKVTVLGQDYAFHSILKDDFFSLNILYTNSANEGYVLKLSDFRFLFGWVLRPLAAWISKREYSMYRRVAHISGIPTLGPRYGPRGYLHRYIEGKTLHECQRGKQDLPRDFFDQLSSIVAEVHHCRIFYADLKGEYHLCIHWKGVSHRFSNLCVLQDSERSSGSMVGPGLPLSYSRRSVSSVET